MRLLSDLLHRGLALAPEKTALVDGERAFTYRQVAEESFRFAAALEALHGGEAGNRVALLLRNGPEFVFAYLGTAASGNVAVPLNYSLRPDEVAALLRSAGCTCLVTSADLLSGVAAIRERVPSLHTVVCVGGPAEGAVAWADFVAGRPASFAPGTPVAPESVVAFLSTSGSTGSPKLAVLSHANLLSNVLAEAGLYGLGGDDVFACVLPLFHNYALLDSCLLPLYLGATIVIAHHEDAEGLLGLIERHRVSFVALMPAQLSELALRDFGRAPDTSSLRMVQTGGAPLAPAALERFRRRYGLEPLDGYGCSEASSTVTVMPPAAPVRPGSVGRPMPNQEVRVVDEEGREVPAGAEGEVVVRGPNVFAGYFGLPEETARALRGGWLHTGDLGRFDADGYLWITGRKKALINVGGMKVCPAEVEAVLQQVDGVLAACVVPSYHPTLGEVVKAFLEVPEGRRVEAAAVLAHCETRLATHKVPRLVELRPALPRTGSGKVAAAALAEEERRRAWPATAA